MNKKIALVLPAYNEEQGIAAALGNVARGMGHFPDYTFELFPIDDGSQDNTFRVIEAQGQALGLNCHPHKNPENQGLVRTLKYTYERILADHHDVDYILKTDLDADFDQERVLQRLLPYIDDYVDVVAGIRWREITREENAYEFERRTEIFKILTDELGLSKLDPPSAGSQLYTREAAQQIFAHPTVENYDKRWGLDFLVPLVARSLDLDVEISAIENGSYDPGRRPEDKVRLQYDTYLEIIGQLVGKSHEQLSKLYKT